MLEEPLDMIHPNPVTTQNMSFLALTRVTNIFKQAQRRVNNICKQEHVQE
jgi:hypothetical protein